MVEAAQSWFGRNILSTKHTDGRVPAPGSSGLDCVPCGAKRFVFTSLLVPNAYKASDDFI